MGTRKQQTCRPHSLSPAPATDTPPPTLDTVAHTHPEDTADTDTPPPTLDMEDMAPTVPDTDTADTAPHTALDTAPHTALDTAPHTAADTAVPTADTELDTDVPPGTDTATAIRCHL